MLRCCNSSFVPKIFKLPSHRKVECCANSQLYLNFFANSPKGATHLISKNEVLMNYSKDKPVTVLSLGAGVQSSALLLMYYEEKVTPPIDFAVFADTQSEPPEVYDWLKKLTAFVSPKIKVIVDSKGNLAEDFLDKEKRAASIPVFLKNDNRSQGLSWRQCTQDYKIQVVQQSIRSELGYKRRQWMRHHINMVMGISTDEVVRMKPSRLKWSTNLYPLIDDLEMSRQDCIRYVETMGLGTPPRSACFMCPYRSNREWGEMKADQPEVFAAAVDFDEKIRVNNRFNATPYVHRAMKPLSEIDFEEESKDMPDALNNECEGMCGV